MSKKVDAKSLIHLEVEKYSKKVDEMQKYLDDRPIKAYDDSAEVSDDDYMAQQDRMHKEIILQIKLMDALPNWLVALEKLRTAEAEKEPETRGDVSIPGMYKNRK